MQFQLRPTRYPELGYFEHGSTWRIATTEDGAPVGPAYTSKAELLADLDRYAREYLGHADPRDSRIRELEEALRRIVSPEGLAPVECEGRDYGCSVENPCPWCHARRVLGGGK